MACALCKIPWCYIVWCLSSRMLCCSKPAGCYQVMRNLSLPVSVDLRLVSHMQVLFRCNLCPAIFLASFHRQLAEDEGHRASLLTVALFVLLAASRCALQGLQTSSSSSALLWLRWYSFRGFISPQFLHGRKPHNSRTGTERRLSYSVLL